MEKLFEERMMLVIISFGFLISGYFLNSISLQIAAVCLLVYILFSYIGDSVFRDLAEYLVMVACLLFLFSLSPPPYSTQIYKFAMFFFLGSIIVGIFALLGKIFTK